MLYIGIGIIVAAVGIAIAENSRLTSFAGRLTGNLISALGGAFIIAGIIA